jgi:GT2 family glycosyltransferase
MMELSTGMEASPDRRPQLVGILCTYRRPAAALELLDRLAAQTRAPEVVVVVDNGDDPDLQAALSARPPGPMHVTYLAAGANLGPAGAFDLGLRAVSGAMGSEDLVVHLDDDDPPVDSNQLAVLTAELDAAARADPLVGGVGLSGGRLQTRRGVISPVVGRDRLEEVDHLHGGYLPVYRAQALLDVGGNDPTFFYGFEELELGRRLHQRGWKLLVLNELMSQLSPRYPKRSELHRSTFAINAADLGWSRFHKERNLIRVLRREHLWLAIAATLISRHFAKPIASLPRQPRAAARRLVLGIRATVEGLRGSGGIDARYPPP